MSTFPLPTMLLLLLLSLGELRCGMTGSISQVTVPETGVYIVTMVNDLNETQWTYVILQINGIDTDFKAYGYHNLTGGLSVAIPLSAGDRVGGKTNSILASNGAIRLNLGFVGQDKNNFGTFHCKGDVWVDINGDLFAHFYRSYTKAGTWSTITKKYLFDVPKNGVYWVMARPHAPTYVWSTFVIGDGLFEAYTGEGLPSSASGAFYLTTPSQLSIELVGALRLSGDTMLSYVYMEGNTPEQLGRAVSPMAFTSSVGLREGTYGADEKVAFCNDTDLDMGDMYNANTRVFSISISGTYVISLRGHPYKGKALKLDLYRNLQVVFTSFADDWVSSGQAGVFDLAAGDTLYVVAGGKRTVGKNTMISIALLRKKS
ncbi:hypothetical protein V1264_022108 [Littorina saxatilis]